MPSNAVTIRERVDEKRREIRAIEGQAEIKRAELRVIQAECEHKNRRNYTVMGDPTQSCADCDKGFY